MLDFDDLAANYFGTLDTFKLGQVYTFIQERVDSNAIKLLILSGSYKGWPAKLLQDGLKSVVALEQAPVDLMKWPGKTLHVLLQQELNTALNITRRLEEGAGGISDLLAHKKPLNNYRDWVAELKYNTNTATVENVLKLRANLYAKRVFPLQKELSKSTCKRINQRARILARRNVQPYIYTPPAVATITLRGPETPAVTAAAVSWRMLGAISGAAWPFLYRENSRHSVYEEYALAGERVNEKTFIEWFQEGGDQLNLCGGGENCRCNDAAKLSYVAWLGGVTNYLQKVGDYYFYFDGSKIDSCNINPPDWPEKSKTVSVYTRKALAGAKNAMRLRYPAWCNMKRKATSHMAKTLRHKSWCSCTGCTLWRYEYWYNGTKPLRSK